MANNSSNNKNTQDNNKEASKRRSNGRRKIAIETITDSTKKHVTFSKRRVGLFKKASELCALCGVEMAILTFSERGKLFCFGHPNPDAVIHRYLANGTHCLNESNEDHNSCELTLMLEEHNKRHNEIKRKIEEEKRLADYEKTRVVVKNEKKNKENDGFWWDEAPIDEMGLDELEQFMTCLVELRNNVAKKANELTGSTLPFLSTQMNNVVDQINFNRMKSNINLGYSSHQGFGTVGNLNCSDNPESFASPAGMLSTNNSLVALGDSTVDLVSQSFNSGFMNEARAMNKMIENGQDFTHVPNLPQGMECFNVAVMNHQVTVKEDHGSTLSNTDIVPRQAIQFETRPF